MGACWPTVLEIQWVLSNCNCMSMNPEKMFKWFCCCFLSSIFSSFSSFPVIWIMDFLHWFANFLIHLLFLLYILRNFSSVFWFYYRSFHSCYHVFHFQKLFRIFLFFTASNSHFMVAFLPLPLWRYEWPLFWTFSKYSFLMSRLLLFVLGSYVIYTFFKCP